MAKRFKVHKGLRAAKDKAEHGKKPENLLEPTRKMSSKELELRRQRARAAGTLGKPAHIQREREFDRRDRTGQW